MSIEKSVDRNVFDRSPLTRRALLSQGARGVSRVEPSITLHSKEHGLVATNTRQAMFHLKSMHPEVEMLHEMNLHDNKLKDLTQMK